MRFLRVYKLTRQDCQSCIDVSEINLLDLVRTLRIGIYCVVVEWKFLYTCSMRNLKN